MSPKLFNLLLIIFGALNACGQNVSPNLESVPFDIARLLSSPKITNSAQVSAISCNNWLHLPAMPSYVDVGDLDVSGDQLTVEAEINRTTPYIGGSLYAGDIVSKHRDPVNINYLLRPNSAEITTADGKYHITPPICEIQLNKTYHVAMVYDGVNLKFYRNGILMSQTAVTGNLFQNDFPTRIGLYQAMLYNENFIGYVNEVRIWNVARTQAQIQAYMNTPLPSPATQTGLLAYYTFDDLINKQGNPAWNGTPGGSAALNQANPTCAAFVPDNDCCPVLQGSLTGGSICPGGTGYLIFHSFTAASTPPYTITYSDGITSYVQNNVQDGVPFAVAVQPSVSTTYALVSIQDVGTCPSTNITGQTGTITVDPVCDQCSHWLSLPAQPAYVDVGNLNVTGDQITVEAEINRTTAFTTGTYEEGDVVSKHNSPADVNYLLRPNHAYITTTNGFFGTPDVCDIQLNKTYHIAMVYDGATLKFYRNGFLMSQVAATGTLFQNGWQTRIGFYFSQFYNENFIGYINNVRIWNVARTQAQIQAFMNSPLPSPATQPGLLACYTFDDLLNKQGNPAWNGTLGGSAAINQTNPTCASFVAENDCCTVLSGTISGNTICSGATGLLIFHSTTPIKLPYIITYSDGINTYVQSNVQDGIPFSVAVQPTATTVYTLVSIQGSTACPPTPISGQTGTINYTNCFCSGSLGDPVVNVNFGSGTNPGPSLPVSTPGASTTMTFVSVTGNPATPTPLDGQYTVTTNIPANSSWFAGAPDHTSGDGKGYMAFYNASEQPGEFYNQRIDNLCGETTYQFAAWIANAVNPALLAGVQPDITFRIEQTDGVLLGSYNTGPIAETTAFTWNQYGFFFTTPGNVSSVVLKMINNSPGGVVTMGNDLAIDDISFRACGPLSTASFNAFGSTLTQTICEGSWAMLYGTVSAGYLHPVNGWQTSTDNGLTWSDIPNSASLQLKVTPPVAGVAKTYLYRMLTAEQDNIQSPYCRVESNEISLATDAGPLLQITHDTSICAGSSLPLLVSGGNTYAWSPAIYLDKPGAANPVATPVTETKFLVTAIDLQLCESRDSVTLSIRPDVIFKAPTDTAVCTGDQVILKGNNDPAYWYSWSPAVSLDNPAAANPAARPAATTQYFLHIEEPLCHAQADFPLTVTVNPLPVVTASSSNDIDCLTGISQLQAGGGAVYSWTPAEGLNDPDINNPVAAIDTTTSFTVNARDSLGCTGSAFVKVVVTDHGKASLILPNAFTPNNDGVNDCFGIRRWGNVTIKEFSIYNRWGQKVFDTRNPSECWNGTFHGEMQDSGGYVYVIKAVSFCGNITRTGTVMLIR